ncbi:hypothetical protein BURMUCF2_A0614 [Burkholderia multivorans CF2]|nr:hypothetical protein BURMUCF2_A0636 [Burkholderia multivorans CF2]EJO59873.1 hypothetical protein BURMUCF2_A0614 [Burkholderia multivorans CF2]
MTLEMCRLQAFITSGDCRPAPGCMNRLAATIARCRLS